MKLVVGLTGGVASGKSLVGDMLQRLGAEVVDADQVARDVVRPGQDGLSRLVEHFGPGILEGDGTLARRRMREMIFSQPDARKTVESILHPLIHAALGRHRNALSGEYGIFIIPLLARTGMRDLVNRVLVVDTPEALQVERLMKRDNISRDLAERMLAAQESRQRRLEIADDVLLNENGPEQLEGPVAKLHAHYLGLARGSQKSRKRLHLP